MDLNPTSKHALLIGINYRGTGIDLQGCINDVNNMSNYLIKERGYIQKNITVLTDNTKIKPTSFDIQMAITKLIATPGARELWLHYSGHGTYTRDLNRDERDGRDECIVPLDFKRTGLIVDDTLNRYVCVLSNLCRMICIFDSCFSGTVLDLKYMINDTTCTIDNPKSNMFGKIILISGCTDSQTSADAYNAKTKTWAGAMTSSFLACVRKNIPYMELLKDMRKNLASSGFIQRPVLTCSKELTTLDTL